MAKLYHKNSMPDCGLDGVMSTCYQYVHTIQFNFSEHTMQSALPFSMLVHLKPRRVASHSNPAD